MLVKMIRSQDEGRPAAIEAILPKAQTFISTGRDYVVHAVSMFQGIVFLQVVDDLSMINWYPTWFFETCDATVPDDWICNVMDGDLQLILGPAFVAVDEVSYSKMVELDSGSVAQFWQRLEGRT